MRLGNCFRLDRAISPDEEHGCRGGLQKDHFDEYSNFARIGDGSLGGKGRGLAFIGAMVKRYPKLESDNFAVNIPKTVVICTDIFDEFMETNELYPVALGDADDETILRYFLRPACPPV